MQTLPQGEIHVRAHIRLPVLGIADPESQIKIHRRIAKLHHIADRLAFRDHPVHGLRGFDGEGLHRLEIARIVRHAKRRVHAHDMVGFRPVGDAVIDEMVVRQQHFRAVARADRHIARLHPRHPAELAVHLDGVAGFDGFVRQKRETGGEVRDRLLQAQTDADTDGAGENRQGGEIEARHLQCDQQRQDRQEHAQNLRDQRAERRRNLV